jgi:hypothetical protein
MVRSPRSRGKGNRRFPGREGGKRKRKAARPWERRCQHLVADVAELQQPVTTLWYGGPWGTELEHQAYVFDQEMARLEIRYFAVLAVRYRRYAWHLTVAESDAEQVAETIARLERR